MLTYYIALPYYARSQISLAWWRSSSRTQHLARVKKMMSLKFKESSSASTLCNQEFLLAKGIVYLETFLVLMYKLSILALICRRMSWMCWLKVWQLLSYPRRPNLVFEHHGVDTPQKKGGEKKSRFRAFFLFLLVYRTLGP